MVQQVEQQPSKCEVLSSTPGTTKTQTNWKGIWKVMKWKDSIKAKPKSYRLQRINCTLPFGETQRNLQNKTQMPHGSDLRHNPIPSRLFRIQDTNIFCTELKFIRKHTHTHKHTQMDTLWKKLKMKKNIWQFSQYLSLIVLTGHNKFIFCESTVETLQFEFESLKRHLNINKKRI
jgi:hypothetical protein